MSVERAWFCEACEEVLFEERCALHPTDILHDLSDPSTASWIEEQHGIRVPRGPAPDSKRGDMAFGAIVCFAGSLGVALGVGLLSNVSTAQAVAVGAGVLVLSVVGAFVGRSLALSGGGRTMVIAVAAAVLVIGACRFWTRMVEYSDAAMRELDEAVEEGRRRGERTARRAFRSQCLHGGIWDYDCRAEIGRLRAEATHGDPTAAAAAANEAERLLRAGCEGDNRWCCEQLR